jgi:hypothetical protein
MGPQTNNPLGNFNDIQDQQAKEQAFIDKWANSKVVVDSVSPQSAPQGPQPQVFPPQSPYIQQDMDPSGFSQSPPPQINPQPAPQVTQTVPVDNHTDSYATSDNLALISLVLCVASPIAGLILSVISLKRAKKAGIHNQLARTSLLVNIIFLIFFIGALIFIFMPTEPLYPADPVPVDTGGS